MYRSKHASHGARCYWYSICQDRLRRMSRAPRSRADRELQAMGAILDALKGLEGESIQRVLDYVLGRLSLNRPTRPSLSSTVPSSLPGDGAKARQASIRDLKEEKQPESLNQMA